MTIAHETPVATPLDRLMAADGQPQGTVMVIGVTDVLSTLGSDLQHRLRPAGAGGAAGERPAAGAAQLDAVVARQAPAAIVVGPGDQPGVVAGWRPPGYRDAGLIGPNRVFVVGAGARP